MKYEQDCLVKGIRSIMYVPIYKINLPLSLLYSQRSEQQSMRYTDRSGLGTKYPNSLADTMTRMP